MAINTVPATRGPQRGCLIVLEGLDRAGKSTMVSKLTTHFTESKHLRFPNRTTATGKIINDYLESTNKASEQAIHLLFVANRWEMAEEIENSLKAGNDVIVDRYYYSGMVYTAAKDKELLGMEWARSAEVGLPRPDMVFFLDIDPEVAAKRPGYGMERYENIAMQKRVRSLFWAAKQANEEGEDMIMIDANRPVDDVFAEILRFTDIYRSKSSESIRRVGKWDEASVEKVQSFNFEEFKLQHPGKLQDSP
jgi:dTMP kinase